MDEQDVGDLKEELEQFKKEKERVRTIVGSIGGVPSMDTKIFNIVFTLVVVICLLISLLSGDNTIRLAMIELAVVAVSIKLIYLIHNQSRVNHFQLWILSSIEWRLDEINRSLNQLEESKKAAPLEAKHKESLGKGPSTQ